MILNTHWRVWIYAGLLGLLLMASRALAFGAQAHRIVGYVAEQQVCTETRLALLQLIPGENLADAGLWADRIRGNPDWDIARTWHYINVPDGVALADAERLNSGDVLAAIDRFEQELRDPGLSQQQRREALYFLVHFIADIHQPLHVGLREDRGGNLIKVRVNGAVTNLHAFWDTGVLKGEVDQPRDYAAQLTVRFAAELAAEAGEPADWARESIALRPAVYDFDGAADAGRITLDSAYQARAREIVDLRMAEAGSRLAASLDAVWCPDEAQSQ